MKAEKNKKLMFSGTFLIILHAAGIIGIHSPYRDLFLSLTPFNLIISAALLMYNNEHISKPFLLFALLIFSLGFLIEYAGVTTKAIFGSYRYEGTLGWKLANVPVVIGVNWFMLVYSAGVITNKINTNRILKSIAGAALLLLLDLLIEQNAFAYGFWSWLDGDIPLQNYIAWFIISFAFLFIFHSFKFNKENKLAPLLYIVQLIFFALLLIF